MLKFHAVCEYLVSKEFLVLEESFMSFRLFNIGFTSGRAPKLKKSVIVAD